MYVYQPNELLHSVNKCELNNKFLRNINGLILRKK